MINHGRTLLINVSGSNRPALGTLGEEHIPADYRPVEELSSVRAIRQVLFGGDPDTFTLNYRAAQYTGLLHADPVAEPYLLALDSRVTYRDGSGLFDQQWGITASRLKGDAELHVIGEYAGEDNTGHNFESYILRTDTVTELITELHAGITQTVAWSPSTVIGPEPFLHADNIFWALQSGTADSSWSIEMRAMPARSLASILLALGTNSPLMPQAASTAEPYKTFLKMFKHGETSSRKLCGALLTVIYRNHEAYLERTATAAV